jgi:TolB protein
MNAPATKLTTWTVVMLGAAAMLPAAATGSDTWADNGRIIYISCVMGECDPFTSKNDGTGEKPISITGFQDTPTISDNGKRIAFREGGDIWVGKSDGTDLDNITNSPGVTEVEPDISPDGKSIVYTTSNGPTGDIVRSKIDGSDVTPVLDGADDDRAPEWSPDGKRIAFHRYDSPQYDLYSVKKDGSDVDRLTDTGSKSEVNPTWSPDGKRIALTHAAGPGTKLKTIAATGGSGKTVKVDSLSPNVPSWSPNGKRLSYFSSEGGQSDVFTVKLNGKGKRNITDDLNSDFFYD